MAEPQNGRHTPEQYEETTDPKNPPNSVINPQVRSAALGSYLGPLVVFFVVIGLALVYWANRGPLVPDPDRALVGTTGNPTDDRPGGFNPEPRPDSTAEELKYRGVDQPGTPLPGLRRELTLTGLAMLEGEPKDLVGRRIEIRNVNVVDAQDPSLFWVQNGNVKAEVSAPRGGPAVKSGSKVNVSGVVEEDGRGGVRIRAERVDVN